MHVRKLIRDHFTAVCAGLTGATEALAGRTLVEDLDDTSQNVWRVATDVEQSEKQQTIGGGVDTLKRTVQVTCIVFLQDIDEATVLDRLDGNAELLEQDVEDTPQNLFTSVELTQTDTETNSDNETERVTGVSQFTFEVEYWTPANDPASSQ